MAQSLLLALTNLLNQAGQAHHNYEQTVLNGVYDQDWPDWYAQYVLDHGLNDLLHQSLQVQPLSEFLRRSSAEYQASATALSWAEATAQQLLQQYLQDGRSPC